MASTAITGARVSADQLAIGGGTPLSQIAFYSQAIDLASLAGGAIVDTTVNTTAGVCDANDEVLFIGAAALEAGLLVQGIHTVGTDTFKMRVYNPTAGAIDAASRTFRFLVLRQV